MSTLMERSYRIARDGKTVVCDTLALRGEIDVLRDALGWKRDRLALLDHDDADAVLVLRSWMTLDDMLAATDVTERDVESYQPLEERDRIALLRELGGPLMDCCCEFVAAQAEVREPPLPV
jgi:hypothetical protein